MALVPRVCIVRKRWRQQREQQENCPFPYCMWAEPSVLRDDRFEIFPNAWLVPLIMMKPWVALQQTWRKQSPSPELMSCTECQNHLVNYGKMVFYFAAMWCCSVQLFVFTPGNCRICLHLCLSWLCFSACFPAQITPSLIQKNLP